jgi:hypothetical protein
MTSVLRDKLDNLRGLSKKDTDSRQVTTYQHIIQIDSRDCVGTDSLACARKTFELNGGRKEATGVILGITGTLPIKIGTETSSVSGDKLKNGDLVSITGVQGNVVVNNTWRISNLTVPDLTLPYPGSSFQINAISNGIYAGGGSWLRVADPGYPTTSDTTNIIIGNEMIIPLQKRLKAIRSIALNVSVIPRDIIPICSYYKDLYKNSILDPVIYATYIPQETKFMESNSYGFYSTNISIFRTYNGAFAVPNQVTAPPLTLWNPPVGAWPNQPLPYPYQTVPTYRSGNITVNGITCYLICSGYGVYDLNDWTAATQAETEIARKALLTAIIRPQTYNGVNYADMIANCSTTSNGVSPFGYGQFQRFLCGPGLQLNYQPGTSDGANPSVAQPDWPIAFPNFKGNVWGPYDSPGSRFQKSGLRDTLQDLFLNGDLDNLFGFPIIKPDLQIANIINDPDYGLNIKKCIDSVNFMNVSNSTNYNITNAMRIVQNGFGASVVTAQGSGNPYYTKTYQNSGGIGPSSFGTPVAWSLTGVYGPPNLDDPNAVGPLSWNLLTNGTIPQTAVGNLPPGYPAQTDEISHLISWYDLGASQGAFKSQMKSYVLYAIANLPTSNLVIKAFQFPRDERVQSTNSEVGSSILNIPIRLLPDVSSDGGFQYVEALMPLLSQASDLEYWGQRFLTPMASLDKISLKFYTYEGTPIPLERQLSYKNICSCPCSGSTSSLLRSRREISLLFRAECYQYVNTGLDIIEMIDKILGIDDTTVNNNESFMVRASNYQDYS